MTRPALTPRLVVRDAAAALDFYRQVLGAIEEERFTSPDGKIVHAAASIGSSIVAVKDADDFDPAPDAATCVILSLEVADPDAVFAAAIERGAESIFGISDQPYGHRGGRFRDPFGHQWIVWRELREMSPDEIQKSVDAMEG